MNSNCLPSPVTFRSSIKKFRLKQKLLKIVEVFSSCLKLSWLFGTVNSLLGSFVSESIKRLISNTSEREHHVHDIPAVHAAFNSRTCDFTLPEGSRQWWTPYRARFVNFCRLFMFLINLCYAV